MSKSKNRKVKSSKSRKRLKKRRAKQLLKPKTTQKKKSLSFSSIWKKVKFWFFGALTVFGFGLGIYNLAPPVEINTRELIEEKNPFYYPFEIKNSSLFNIKDFSYSMIIDELELNNGIKYTDVKASNRTDIRLNLLTSYGVHPINLDDYFGIRGYNVKQAVIHIEYSYSYLKFIHINRDHKFKLLISSTGKYSWRETQ